MAHYLGLHAKCRAAGGSLAETEHALALALVRYCDVLPADRVFYEAGQACKRAGKLNQAFVLTNRFLDICDALDEVRPRGGLWAAGVRVLGRERKIRLLTTVAKPMQADGSSMIDNTDFENTDVPFAFNLPDRPFVPEKEREEVRDWVLTLSMDQKVEPVLSMKPCYKCSAHVWEAALACPSCKAVFKPCVVTGMPVPRGRGELPPEEVFLHFHQGASFKDYIQFTLKN
jgi:intraflagellar transport protein 172